MRLALSTSRRVPSPPGMSKTSSGGQSSNERLLSTLRKHAQTAKLTTSVCTGAGLLAAAGLLDGKRATSNKLAFAWVRSQGPRVEWVPEARWVEDENVVTSAGVSAGIDMALYLVGLLASPEVARNVQKFIEYYPEPPYAEEEAIAAGKEAS